MKKEEHDAKNKPGFDPTLKDGVLAGIKALKEDLARCRKEIEKLTGDNASLSSQLDQKGAELRNLQADFNVMSQKRKEADEKGMKLEKELADANARIAQLTEELADAKKSMEEIRKALEF